MSGESRLHYVYGFKRGNPHEWFISSGEDLDRLIALAKAALATKKYARTVVQHPYSLVIVWDSATASAPPVPQ